MRRYKTVEILIGADPELFMTKGGEYISAHGVIPGTKSEPFLVEHGAVQVDGMALEFNIDPASNEEEFLLHINSVMATLEGMVGDKADSIVAEPVADFTAEHMEAQPPEAKEMGCEPDFNAWDDKPNGKPDGSVNFRTAGGHIHIGWTEDQDISDPSHLEACVMLVKQLDNYLFLPSLLWDRDDRRRKLYGKIGDFRPKPYGVEYRVLSNKWLDSDKLKGFVYRQTIKAFNKLMEGKRSWEHTLPRLMQDRSRGDLRDKLGWRGIVDVDDLDWLMRG